MKNKGWNTALSKKQEKGEGWKGENMQENKSVTKRKEMCKRN